MKKLLIVLIALLTLVAFVACDSDSSSKKDPAQDNLAIGKWTAIYVDTELNLTTTYNLEINSNKSATMVTSTYSSLDPSYPFVLNFSGTWTATSSTEGTISMTCAELPEETADGSFIATATTLTVTIEEAPMVFTKAI